MVNASFALLALPWIINNTLPSYYQNCSVPSVNKDCWEGLFTTYTTLPQILYMALRDQEMRKAWGCADIEMFCSRVNAQTSFLESVNLINYYTGVDDRTLSADILAPLSIIFNVLLFLSFWSKTLEGAEIFWYLKSIALAQICQAIAIICFFNKSWYPFRRGELGFLAMTALFNYIFDGARVFGVCMSFFMSLTRFVAVCYPLKHNTLVWWKWFLGALAYSIIMAATYLIFLAQYTTKAVYETKINWIFNNIFAPFTTIHGVVLIISSFVFSIRIAVFLWRRSRKIATMMSAAAVKNEHRNMVSLFRVQILETLTLTYDMCVLIFVPLARASWVLGDCKTKDCDAAYMTPSVVFPTQALIFFLNNMYNLLSTFRGNCHIELFFLYMIFAGKIRGAFKDICVCCFRLLKKAAGKLCKCSKISTNNVIVINVRTENIALT